jgi:acyl carrier protein
MDATRQSRVEEIFRIVLGLPDDAAVAGMTRAGEPRWDSLAHVSLLVSLEQELNIAFPRTDRAAMDSFAAVVAAVERLAG